MERHSCNRGTRDVCTGLDACTMVAVEGDVSGFVTPGTQQFALSERARAKPLAGGVGGGAWSH